MQRDGIFGRVHQGAEFIANFESQHPPALFPGANAARGPDVGVGVERVIHGAWHGSEGVGDHVVGALEDGELGTVAEEVVVEKIVTQKIGGHEDIVIGALTRWESRRWIGSQTPAPSASLRAGRARRPSLR